MEMITMRKSTLEMSTIATSTLEETSNGGNGGIIGGAVAIALVAMLIVIAVVILLAVLYVRRHGNHKFTSFGQEGGTIAFKFSPTDNAYSKCECVYQRVQCYKCES